MWRHLEISCGCFSAGRAGKINCLTLIRATVITLVSAAAYAGTLLPIPNKGESPAILPKGKNALPVQYGPDGPERLFSGK